MKKAAWITAIALFGGPAPAQDSAPMSAIDWLSRSVVPMVSGAPVDLEPVQIEPTGATTPEVTVVALDAPSPDVIGILPPSATGLPRRLWGNGAESTLVQSISEVPVETLPAMRDMMVMMLLAEADAPIDAGPEGRLFLARVDKLLDLGALDQAQALLEAAGPSDAEQFRRWFDITLLTGTEDKSCAALRDAPDLSPTYATRIFCIARGGDWDSAALILNTGRALGDIPPDIDALLERFLDTAGDDSGQVLTPPDRISPLVFRLYEAIGEPFATANLPRAFAFADLRPIASWRNQLEAAERLARAGDIDANVLHALYTRQTPAASGGIWDRAAAYQAVTQAIRSGDADAVAATLAPAWAAMKTARTETVFARTFAQDLLTLPLTGTTQDLAFEIALLSPLYETAAQSHIPTTVDQAFWIAVAKGDLSQVTANTRAQEVVLNGFSGATPVAPQVSQYLADGNIGQALIYCFQTFSDGLLGDPSAISAALTTLRTLGLEDTARRAALQYLLLEGRG